MRMIKKPSELSRFRPVRFSRDKMGFSVSEPSQPKQFRSSHSQNGYQYKNAEEGNCSASVLRVRKN